MCGLAKNSEQFDILGASLINNFCSPPITKTARLIITAGHSLRRLSWKKAGDRLPRLVKFLHCVHLNEIFHKKQVFFKESGSPRFKVSGPEITTNQKLYFAANFI